MDVTTHINMNGFRWYPGTPDYISIGKTVQILAKDIADDLKLPVYRYE